MIGYKSSSLLKRIWLLSVFAIILGAFSVSVIAIPVAPGPPPPGKEWQWYDAHWELVMAPPPGSFEWHQAHWDKGVWVEGDWVPLKVKKNREWVPAHYEPEKGVWVEGYWAKRRRDVLVPEKTPKEQHVPGVPPPAKAWVWEPGHWHLVEAAPPQPSKWVPAHWDVKLGMWIEGAWVVLDTPAPAGRAWIAGHWDPVKRVWIAGGWGNPGPPGHPGVRSPRPVRPAGPGMIWVWDPIAGDWVARPR